MRNLRVFFVQILGLLTLGPLLTVLSRAFLSRRRLPLKLWHQVAPDGEFSASDGPPSARTWAEYQALENTLFDNVKTQVYQRIPPADNYAFNRYTATAPSHVDHFSQNWNRSFERRPSNIQGGILLLHGLSDAPHSQRHLADIFAERNFYVLTPRLPGHGTTPAALKNITRQDWAAVVRLAVQQVRDVIGPTVPLYVSGYSNGATLALQYALNALEDDSLPQIDHLIFISPALGLSNLIHIGPLELSLSRLPVFESFAWQDIYPPYEPFKYTSFPKHAGYQAFLLTLALRKQILRLAKAGRLADLPPILTFQSLVDDTILRAELFKRLYKHLPANGSELVLFDVNRHRKFAPFLHPKTDVFLDLLYQQPQRRYALSLLTNRHPDTDQVLERHFSPGQRTPTETPLSLAWPAQVYSLSHVSLPFPPSDSVYGAQADLPAGAFNVGSVQLRGERNTLTVPHEQLMRLRYNPFFDYLSQRLSALTD